MRICIYGGTDLQGVPTKFVAALAYQILQSFEKGVIVTGGFLRSHGQPDATSTDAAALNGARRYANERNIDLRECYQAWIPDPKLDSRPDVKGAVRMSAEDGVTVRTMSGLTPLGRRLAMVADVQMVVTISGRQHTEVVVEQALELGVPVLPIPDAGGDSEALLGKYRGRIAAAFGTGALDACLRNVSTAIASDPQTAAAAVVTLIKTAKIGKCLVLLPYDTTHDALYATEIEPAVAAHMMPVRLDRLPSSDAIYTTFTGAVRSCSALIADITLLNENVMYEVGYAHGLGLTPLIYTRDSTRLHQLPVYFRTLNVRSTSPAMPVRTLVDEYLRSLKHTRH
jgi:hypothetical protein